MRKWLLLQFLHLQQDYEYNLELLDGRDAELERYDKEFDAIGQELAAKDSLMTQLHARLAKAESGLHLSYIQDAEVAPHLEPNSRNLLVGHAISLSGTQNLWKY